MRNLTLNMFSIFAPILLIAQQDTIHVTQTYHVVKEKREMINEYGQTLIMTYINDKKNGVGIRYNPDGSIHARANFLEDSIHGKQIIYHKNGAINIEEFFHKGIQHGEKLITLANGDTAYHAFFDMGKLHGEETYYRKGRPIFTATFEQGKEIGSKEYRKNGNPKIFIQKTEEGYKEAHYRKNGNLKVVYEKGEEIKFDYYRKNGTLKSSNSEDEKQLIITTYDRNSKIKDQFFYEN